MLYNYNSIKFSVEVVRQVGKRLENIEKKSPENSRKYTELLQLFFP